MFSFFAFLECVSVCVCCLFDQIFLAWINGLCGCAVYCKAILNLLRRTFWDFGGFAIQNSVAQRGWIPTLPNSLLPLFWCMAYLQTYMHRPFPFLKCRWKFHHFIGWTDERMSTMNILHLEAFDLKSWEFIWYHGQSLYPLKGMKKRKMEMYNMWQIQWFHDDFPSEKKKPPKWSEMLWKHGQLSTWTIHWWGGHPVLMMYRRLPILLLQNGPPNSQDLIAIHLRKWARRGFIDRRKALR